MSTRSARRGLAVGLLLVWFALPLVPILVWAFADRWSWPGVLPQEWGWRGWDGAVAADALPAAGRSLVLGVVVAAVATPLGAMAGRVLGWRLTRRPWLASVILLAPVALPPFAVAMGLATIVLRLGIPDQVAVILVLTVFALPYATYVVRAAYAAVDPTVEDQARMLGANASRAFWRVTVPAIRPALAAAAALAFLVGWSDYVVTVVIGGGQLVTMPVLLAAQGSGTGNQPVLAALALGSLLPLLGALLLGGFAHKLSNRRKVEPDER